MFSILFTVAKICFDIVCYTKAIKEGSKLLLIGRHNALTWLNDKPSVIWKMGSKKYIEYDNSFFTQR